MSNQPNKLTAAQAREAKSRHEAGESYDNIAADMDVARSTVRSAALSATAAKPEEQAPVEQRVKDMLDKRGKLPPVPAILKATKIEDMGFATPQPSIVLFSDLHMGSDIDIRVTGGLAEYNMEIARERLTKWRNTVLRFLQLDGYTTNIPSLHMFDLGDDMEGHGEMFPTQKLQMVDSIMFQYAQFVEDMTEVIISFLQRVPKVVVYKVPGNHGRVSANAKGDYPPDNFEIMAWEHIADRVAAECGGKWSYTKTGIHCLTGGKVDFYISRAFFITALIEGKLIYARHGHRIGGLNRTYTGAVDNMFRMNAILGRVANIMFKAHLHEAQEAEPMIDGQVIQNGCFVGPSLLSVEMNRASASLPSQEMYSIHPKHGLTNHHRIRLAEPADIQQAEAIDFLTGQGVDLVGS
jgi:hypothetical protein